MNAGINPAAACGGAVILQFGVLANKFASVGAITVDFADHGVDARFLSRPFGGIVPGESVQTCVALSFGVFRLLLHATTKVIHEPGLAAAIAWRFHGFLMELQQPLRVGETAFFLDVGCRRKKENLG